MGKALVLILAVVGLVLLAGGFYTVHETEQVIITRFGEPVSGPITAAGPHFKMPFIDSVRRFERRILEWDGDENDIVTRDKKTIRVDTTARWRISDPLKFLKSVHDERSAKSRLDDILDGATREFISKNNLIEAVRASNREFAPEEGIDLDLGDGAARQETIAVGRDRLIASIVENAQRNVAELGIQIVDVRIRRIDYNEKVRLSVYERMIAERNQIADKYRSEGRGKASEIEGKMEKELKRIESEAFRQAETIRGAADAEATKIYAEAFGADEEFYAFYQTLETCKKALSGGNTTMVLSSGSELLKYLKDPGTGK